MSVVGGPSLSAAAVDHIFAQAGSPMVGTGAIVEQASRTPILMMPLRWACGGPRPTMAWQV
ncbi:hypothetical protein KDK_22880 [Dictyobacter kobayashii]|uniref:Uncharacterized protein n=2 Tax=Dictyobacter kobayashii TaxID=2014872 RepID=A0A402AH93_9CHLR|nr:hypothetical protein KDK_22880 [Dictyobacter kobayashii]